MDVVNPYTLPRIDFVGGSTQDLVFHCYYFRNKRPHDLSFCTANFSVINYVNKKGLPVISKQMSIGATETVDGKFNNILSVTLTPNDTVGLPTGKYIYQISIRDISGNVDIPNQGIIYIINNINKSFIK